MEEGFKDKIKRMKVKADLFLDKEIKTFIVDINNDFYFCNIESVEEDSLVVLGFAGRRKFERDKIFFIDILRFEEYHELEEGK